MRFWMAFTIVMASLSIGIWSAFYLVNAGPAPAAVMQEGCVKGLSVLSIDNRNWFYELDANGLPVPCGPGKATT